MNLKLGKPLPLGSFLAHPPLYVVRYRKTHEIHEPLYMAIAAKNHIPHLKLYLSTSVNVSDLCEKLATECLAYARSIMSEDLADQLSHTFFRSYRFQLPASLRESNA